MSAPAPVRSAPHRVVAGAASIGAHLPPLLVAADHVANTVAQGVHGRRRPGQGDSFWQYRPLQPGESAARIDWRQSARSGKTYVRQTEWEAAQTVGLWHAADAGMAWRSSASLPTKLERAQLLLLALAALLLRAGEQTRLLGRSGPPFTGRAGLHRLAATLGEPRTGEATRPNLSGLPRHATIVLIGDWLAPPETTQALLAALASVPTRGHLLQILDPAEIALPYHGRVRFGAADQGAALGAHALIGRVETVREAYQHRLLAHQEQLAALCRVAGFGWSVHHTDQPPQTALMALHAALSPDRVAAR